MSFLGFLVLLLLAALSGAIAQSVTGYSMGGCLVSMFLGFVGAAIGLWIANALDMPMILSIDIEGNSFPIVWATLGAVIFATVVGFFTRRRR